MTTLTITITAPDPVRALAYADQVIAACTLCGNPCVLIDGRWVHVDDACTYCLTSESPAEDCPNHDRHGDHIMLRPYQTPVTCPGADPRTCDWAPCTRVIDRDGCPDHTFCCGSCCQND